MSSQVERDKIRSAVAWVGERIRDVLRGYSDQKYLKYLAVASGQITPADSESYKSRRLYGVYFVPRMPLPNPGTDSIVLDSAPIGNFRSFKQELTRLRQLTPGELDEEIRNDAVRWLDEHRLQIPEPSLE